jgi:hypothetical protein
MSANRDAIVQEIRRDFEKLLESVWEQRGVTRIAYEVEKHLFASLLSIGRALLLLYFVSQSETYRAKEVTNSNGETIPHHSERSRSYRSVFGKIEFCRSYYYGRGSEYGSGSGSGQSQCPADAAMNLPRTQCSDLLREWFERLGVCDPYAKSAEFLAGILGQPLWQRDLKAEIEEDAGLVEEFYQQTPLASTAEEAPILVVQADGKGVPIIREEPVAVKARLGKGEKPGRKKEAIVTATYTIHPCVRTPQAVVQSLFEKDAPNKDAPNKDAPNKDVPNKDVPNKDVPNKEMEEQKKKDASRSRPQNKRYWATLDGKQAAMEFTKQQVSRREGVHIEHKLALTDGSPALQEQVRDALPDYRLILDFIHADEYLWKAGNALFGEKNPKRQEWVQALSLEMLSGQTDAVIAQLRMESQKAGCSPSVRLILEQVANYCERNIEFMRYNEYLAAGWPIATGVIEGACRHVVKDRCELSGMRWSQPGVEALLRMRCVEENGDWESFHEYRRSRRQQTLYQVINIQPLDLMQNSSEGAAYCASYCAAYKPPHIRLAA